MAFALSFGPLFLIADAAHAEEQIAHVSVELTVNEQITQAEITLTNATSEIQVITQDLTNTSNAIQQLVNGGSTNLATVNEAIQVATTAVADASTALSSASEALWDAKEKQDSYELAVAASELADSNLESAQSNYNQSLLDLSSISAAVSAQQQVVQQEQSELNQLQNQPSNSYEASSPGWTNSTEASTSTGSTVTLPAMWDASTKIDLPFDIKMGNTLYEGQGSASQIYVTSKAFISFGQPDHTFWDWPQTTGIYVYQSDWMTAGAGAYTKITTTENTLKIEWSLHRFGDSNGPLTNVIWNMTVDPANGEWTGYSEISGNTSNLYGGPRIGVRYSNGGTIETMSPRVLDSVSAELIAQQQQVVASESVELVNLQTQQALQTTIVQDNGQILSLATSTSSQANTLELAALQEFTQALQNTQSLINNLVVIVDNAETKTQTAYVVVQTELSNLPAPTQPPVVIPDPTPLPEETVSPEPTPEETVSPEPEEENPVEPSPEPTPIPPKEEPTPTPSPSEEPSEEPEENESNPLPEPEPNAPTEELGELTEIAPEDLSPEQVEELIVLAEAILETAEPGSEEYEQALDALLLAAQADDVELPAELAAIPLIGDVAGAVLDVLNNLGNVGADMSPKVRETSEEVIVAAVIVGQVSLLATATATATTVSVRKP